MPKKVIIIGGGFAGLSAATALAELGFHVTVLEGRQILGGRAYSFTDPKTGDSVDNGQHLFMGCYHETQRFLKRIGTLERLRFQKNLSVDFIGSAQRARLRCWPLPSPWHLLSGLLRLSTLSWADRGRLFYIHKALREATDPTLDQWTVDQWLTRWNQSPRAKRHLWNLIAIAILNEDPAIASAVPFKEVLARAFFENRKGSPLGFSTVGLSDLYVHAARSFVEKNGGEVCLKSPVQRLECAGDRIETVALREGTRLNADWIVSAVPPWALLKLLPQAVIERVPIFQRLEKLQPSPIISIHLWFDRAISKKSFAGLLDTHIQWFFNKSKIYAHPQSKKGYISVVISGAHPFMDWSETDLLSMVLEELRRLFPKTYEAVLLRSLVIKEHQATLSPTVGCEALRPGCQSPFQNLLLAGDWTKTGLPATIESACVSGHACADMIVKKISSPLAGERFDSAHRPEPVEGDRGGGSPPSPPSPVQPLRLRRTPADDSVAGARGEGVRGSLSQGERDIPSEVTRV